MALPLPEAAAHQSAESAPDFSALLEQMGGPAVSAEESKAPEHTLHGHTHAKAIAAGPSPVEPDPVPESLPVSDAPAKAGRHAARPLSKGKAAKSTAPQVCTTANVIPAVLEWRPQSIAEAKPQDPAGNAETVEAAPHASSSQLEPLGVFGPDGLRQLSKAEGTMPDSATPQPAVRARQVAAPEPLASPAPDELPEPLAEFEQAGPALIEHRPDAAKHTSPHPVAQAEQDPPSEQVTSPSYEQAPNHVAPQPAPDPFVPPSPAVGVSPALVPIQAQPLEPAAKFKQRASSPVQPPPSNEPLPQLSTPAVSLPAADPAVIEALVADTQSPAPAFGPPPVPAPLTPQPKSPAPLQEQIVPFRPPLVAAPESVPSPGAALPAEPLVRPVSAATADRGEVAFVAHLRPAATAELDEPTAPPAPRPESAAVEKPVTPERLARSLAEAREPQPRPEPQASPAHVTPQWTAPVGPRVQAAALPIPESRPEPAQPAPMLAPPASPKPDAPPSASAREIKLEVTGGEQRIEVRLSDRGGEVTVAVRTPDHQLAGSLRENLPQLTARLNESGLRSFEPAAVASPEARQTSETPSGSLRQDQHQQQQNPDPQGDAEQRRHRQPEQTQPHNPKQKGNDFAWLMSTLR